MRRGKRTTKRESFKCSKEKESELDEWVKNGIRSDLIM